MADLYVGLEAIGRRLGCGREAVVRLHRHEGLPLVKLPLKRARPGRSRYAWHLFESALSSWLIAKSIIDRQVLLERCQKRKKARGYPDVSRGQDGPERERPPIARETGPEPGATETAP